MLVGLLSSTYSMMITLCSAKDSRFFISVHLCRVIYPVILIIIQSCKIQAMEYAQWDLAEQETTERKCIRGYMLLFGSAEVMLYYAAILFPCHI